MQRYLLPSIALLFMTTSSFAGEFHLTLRSLTDSDQKNAISQTRNVSETWNAEQTAVIVCDVWDAHHSWNAVQRLEEFAPRMNELLKTARQQGATIIHAPSDCMPSYATHPARARAIAAPLAPNLPPQIKSWVSRIPSEIPALYPVDQSDGGDDDLPKDHAPWAAKLVAMGRNPGLPWKAQSPLIEIDDSKDYISDRGDEVWNILEHRHIQNVILVGVHTNMCVLGRPFGLRQMARNGKHVVLVRDLTDCMYNPQRWPYVNHFTGNDLVIAHVERFVCPTITSDQILGGKPFLSRFDTRQNPMLPKLSPPSPEKDWTLLTLPTTTQQSTNRETRTTWYRCVIRIPESWCSETTLTLQLPESLAAQAWLNGEEFTRKQTSAAGLQLEIPNSFVFPDDANLLVIKIENQPALTGLAQAPLLLSGNDQLLLQGRWQARIGTDINWANMPLPAKFGGTTDIYYEP